MNRFDNRTSKQFQKDIKKSHITEAEIVLRIAYETFLQKGYWPNLTPNRNRLYREISN